MLPCRRRLPVFRSGRRSREGFIDHHIIQLEARTAAAKGQQTFSQTAGRAMPVSASPRPLQMRVVVPQPITISIGRSGSRGSVARSKDISTEAWSDKPKLASKSEDDCYRGAVSFNAQVKCIRPVSTAWTNSKWIVDIDLSVDTRIVSTKPTDGHDH
jgi:hypothetical protein